MFRKPTHSSICKEKHIKLYRMFHRRKLFAMTLKVFFTSILFAVWILGSTLVIQIDSDLLNLEFENENKIITEKLTELEKNIDSYCLLQEQKVVITNKTESERLLAHALQMRTLKENLLYFPELDQMWCLVPKAASSSWSRIIINALNAEQTRLFVDDDETTLTPLQVILKQNYGFISKKIYDDALQSKNVTKVLLVRHPFERIVSAYENKLQDRKAKKDGMYFFQHFGVKINRKFRKNKKLKKKEPTFAEFVQYLINTDPLHYDEHWKPISLLCNLCKVKYDVIIKVEDLHKFSDYYMKRLGFVAKKVTNLPHENSYNVTLSGGSNNYYKYFRNIPDYKILELYGRYRGDFYLFQYSFMDFYVGLKSKYVKKVHV